MTHNVRFEMLRKQYSTVLLLVSASFVASQSATIPSFVLDYAPLIYLDVNEEFYPSDIAAQVINTYSAINFTEITDVPANLSLLDLSTLNMAAGCESFDNCNLYLTSRDTINVSPPYASWLYGVLPNPVTGETEGATSCTVIVTDHGNDTVDAFYMYFYAYNQGIPVGGPNGTVFGNHVGDWEHNMIRFVGGEPVAVYYSEHSGGQAFTYDATVKNGTRPLGFSSKGGHATYPQEGVHSMYANLANDSTSRGPLWDPVAGSGAWYYVFTPATPGNYSGFSNGTFTPVDVEGRTARGVGPTDWLYFYGRWGDKQYNSSHPGQASILSLTAVFVDGPTGPLDKDLYRSNLCPGSDTCVTSTAVMNATGLPVTQTITRNYTSVATTSSGGSGSSSTPTGSGSPSGTGTGSVSSPSTPGKASNIINPRFVLGVVAFVSWLALSDILVA